MNARVRAIPKLRQLVSNIQFILYAIISINVRFAADTYCTRWMRCLMKGFLVG
jgi:hypothetical protein